MNEITQSIKYKIRSTPEGKNGRSSSGICHFQNAQKKKQIIDTIEPCTNVFINYIPSSFTENDLRKLCSQYGDIICSKVMINLETGQSKCFGFVRFATLKQAQEAIKELNGKQIGTKRLLAKYAESTEKHEKVSNIIYIKRLPKTIDINYVGLIFSNFGQIIEIIPHLIDSLDPQFWRCFIRYISFEAASKAISSMNNQIIVNSSRPIHVRYADENRMHSIFEGNYPFKQLCFSSTQTEIQLLPSFLL